MNDLPRIPIRMALRGGPANAAPWAECDVHETTYRQRFITSAMDALTRAGLPYQNAGPVAVDLIYRDTGRYTFTREQRPIFEFAGVTDSGAPFDADLPVMR
jgi:hypothetical protein